MGSGAFLPARKVPLDAVADDENRHRRECAQIVVVIGGSRHRRARQGKIARRKAQNGRSLSSATFSAYPQTTTGFATQPGGDGAPPSTMKVVLKWTLSVGR